MLEEPQILFEDNHCLAVAKPAGLLTQAPPAVPSLEAWAKEYLRAQYGKTGRIYLGVPHRIDRPAGGVVLLARQSKSARRLAEQFQSGSVRKVYWSMVEGSPEVDEGAWEDWIAKVPDEAKACCTEAEAEGAKHAMAQYQVLQRYPNSTLLEVIPKTGRMHQIRLQAARRGTPILGDQFYGAIQPFGPDNDDSREQAIALHARSLTFEHPISYEPLTITAPLPGYWPEPQLDAPD